MLANPRWAEQTVMSVENYAVHHRVLCTFQRGQVAAPMAVDLARNREYSRRNPVNQHSASTKTPVWTPMTLSQSWLPFPKVICRTAHYMAVVHR